MRIKIVHLMGKYVAVYAYREVVIDFWHFIITY